MCITDRHDMTVAVKVALNHNYNQPTIHFWRLVLSILSWSSSFADSPYIIFFFFSKSLGAFHMTVIEMMDY